MPAIFTVPEACVCPLQKGAQAHHGMIEFFFPISIERLPTFRCPDGVSLPRLGLILPRQGLIIGLGGGRREQQEHQDAYSVNSVTLQSLSKHGRPAKKSGDVGAKASEEGGSYILARDQEGYQVPQVHLHLGYTSESIWAK